MKDFSSPSTRFPSALLGSSLVALAYAIGGFGAYAILSDNADLHTRAGRHLLAGALAIATLSAVEVLVALLPLRRRESWAFWAALLPFASLVVPTMLVDAVHVPPEHRFTTLTPFIVGLVLAAIGLFLSKKREGN
jgi:hypothetical protein